MPFIERMPDGTEVLYLTADMQPATRETAALVKVIYPNGDVVWGIPEPDDQAPAILQKGD